MTTELYQRILFPSIEKSLEGCAVPKQCVDRRYQGLLQNRRMRTPSPRIPAVGDKDTGARQVEEFVFSLIIAHSGSIRWVWSVRQQVRRDDEGYQNLLCQDLDVSWVSLLRDIHGADVVRQRSKPVL
jgi:hypothetical protein